MFVPSYSCSEETSSGGVAILRGIVQRTVMCFVGRGSIWEHQAVWIHGKAHSLILQSKHCVAGLQHTMLGCSPCHASGV